MKCIVINLIERPDRLKHFRKEIKKIPVFFSYLLVSTKRMTPGWMGCKLAYLSIFRKYSYNTFIVIFEDDVLFLPDAEDNMMKAIDQLPDNWDMLYLGGYPKKPLERYSDNLFKAKTVLTTHAIMYNNQRHIIDFILKNEDSIQKIDVFFSQVMQDRFNCFIAYPMIATQWENPSDVCENSDYSFIEKQYNLFCHD